MGKKKSFINKKEATTYSLVYRNAQQDDTVPETNEGVLVPVDRLAGRDDTQAPPEDHLAFARSLFHDEIDDISDERRREILEFGFADDGYDYLKHLRVLGKGTASLEGVAGEVVPEQEVAGPSVFVEAPELLAPVEDVKVIDAGHLHVRTVATDETAVEDFSHEVTAYARARPAETLHRNARQEVQELQSSMDEVDKAPDGAEPDYADWLDEFVVAASQPKVDGSHAETGGAAASSVHSDGSGSDSYTDIDTGDEDEEEDDDEEEEGEEQRPLGGHRGMPAVPGSANQPGKRIAGGSIASTYWRPERHDRTNHLDVVDQRFERLALQYEDDELGELEDDDPTLRGTSGPGELLLQRALDDFIADHPKPAVASDSDSQGSDLEVPTDDEEDDKDAASRQGAPAGEPSNRTAAEPLAKKSGQKGGGCGRTGPAVGADEAEDVDKEVVRITKARLRQIQAQGERGSEREVFVEIAEHEQWDCESVLSLLSNRENHPGRIQEPQRQRRPAAAAAGLITLSAKTGLPLPAAQTKPGSESVAPAVAAAPAVSTHRPKDETPEERRARKAAVKEDRRETRAAKKELKVLYKDEAKRQKKQMAATPAVNSIISIA